MVEEKQMEGRGREVKCENRKTEGTKTRNARKEEWMIVCKKRQ